MQSAACIILVINLAEGFSKWQVVVEAGRLQQWRQLYSLRLLVNF